MLRALSFLKQSAGAIFTLKLCWGHSRSWSGLLGGMFTFWSNVEGPLVLEAVCRGNFYFEAMLRALSFLKQSAGGMFSFWSYVEGTLVLETLCWWHFYFEATLRVLSFLKQSAGGIFTLKLCWGHSRSWSSLLGAFLLWIYVEGTLVLEAVCWRHFYFEAMFGGLSFLKQSAGGIITLKLSWGHSHSWSNQLGTFLLWSYVEGTLVLEAVCWGHFYFEAMLRALSFLKQSAGGIFTLKLCWGHSRSWSSLLGAFLLWSYVEGTLVLEAVCWGHFYFEAMLRALSFLKQSAGGIFTFWSYVEGTLVLEAVCCSLLGAFLLWSYVKGTLVLEAVC